MRRLHVARGSLATAILLGQALACPAAIAAGIAPRNDLTAAGLSIAPYVMAHPGELALSVRGGYVDVPGALGYAGGDLGLSLGLLDGLEFLAQGGTETSAGLRGSLWRASDAALAWDARYRVDSYPEQWVAGHGAFGLTDPPAVIGNGSLLPGRFAQGIQLAVESAWELGTLRVYLAPEALAMSNRDALGATLALDQRLGPVVLGVGAEIQDNVASPDHAADLNRLQLRYSAGMRYDTGERYYVSASYNDVPADTYGYSSHTMLVGAGLRLGALRTEAQPTATRFSRDSILVADCLTVAGLEIAPRYLGRAGDVDETLLGDFGNTSSTPTFVQGQLNQVRLPANLVLLTAAGQRAFVGIRGPLWGQSAARLGWDARFRSDPGSIPGTGDSNLGGQLALDSEYRWHGLEAFLAPQALALTDRVAAGAAVGVDDQIGHVALGLGAEAERNFLSPDRAAALNPFQTRYSVGIRYYLNQWAYCQLSYHDVPADTFGRPEHVVEAGLGTRILGTFTSQN